MILDIIIPCFNEEQNLKILLPHLISSPSKDNIKILVVDALKSSDNSQVICEKYDIDYIKANVTQRSIQMNFGAQHSTGDTLLFLHADVKPPYDYYQLISEAIKLDYNSGCFAYQFDSNKLMLRINSFFTQFKGFFTGGGDQTLFITRACFYELGGYCSDHIMMEDFDLYRRIRSQDLKFKIIKSKAKVSARKYEKNSWLRVNLINLIALLQYKVDRDPQLIRSFYNRWLNN